MKSNNIIIAVAVAAGLSVSACTFSSIDADEKAREPQDYGYNVAEDGYIKAFNAGTVKSVETKTLFHTDLWEYGLTTWEPGNDMLSFIKRDPSNNFMYCDSTEHWQIFGCDSSFIKDSYEKTDDIKWAKYTVLDGKKGLRVGENYYAYYMNGREESAIYDYLNIADFNQDGQTDESLQNFMRDNDFLVLEKDQHDGNATANNGIIVESPMRDVYMEHYFSLIEIDVHWKRDMITKDKRGVIREVPVTYPFNSVQFGSGNDWSKGGGDFIYAFAGSVGLDGCGELILNEPTSFATNHRSDTDKTVLTNTNNLLKYYILIHPVEPSNHYWIKVIAAPEFGVTIHYELPEMIEFKPGYYYKFDLDADFFYLTSQTDSRNWQDRGRLYDRDSTYLRSKGINLYYENN